MRESLISKSTLIFLLILGLFLVMALRAMTLELPNLTDPTEGRYALGALDMLQDGQYLVPQILRGDVREPYLGKPPLFFWSTAASIALFGTDEWSVRLPSFLCFLSIAAILVFWGYTARNKLLGFNSALVWGSSLLPFFLCGTVSFDPLVTLFVSALLTISFKLLVEDGGHLKEEQPIRRLFFWRITFWIFAGAGVLVKGPVIALYVALPIFCYCLFSGCLKESFRKLGIFYGPFIAALIFVPWFIAAENSNPGFVKYFLFSENFKRFLVKDYGDRYGTGHEYPYGFSLLFLFLGAFPWSASALGALRPSWRSSLVEVRSRFSNESILRFAFSWALSAPIVLTMAHQLHPGYVLPALPGIAILIVSLFGGERIAKLCRKFLRLLVPLLTIVAIGSLLLNPLGISLSFHIAILVTLALSYVLIQFYEGPSELLLAQAACCTALVFVAVILGATQYVNQRNSSQQILSCLSKNLPKEQPVEVALIEIKQYAAYFFADSWQTELGRQLSIDYKDLDDLPTSLPTHIIVNAAKLSKLHLDPNYKGVAQVGPFLWLSNKPELLGAVVCDRLK